MQSASNAFFTDVERVAAAIAGADAPASAARLSVSPDRSQVFTTLDGLRGIAALAVAARHAPYLWPEGHPTGFLHESYLAVDLFFVLSGFVLAHAYAQRFASGMTVGRFMTLRLVRLYPLYLLAFALSFGVALARLHGGKVGFGEFSGDFVCGLMFLPSPFSGGDLFPMNLPAWSLFFELVANLAFALIGSRMTTRRAAALTLGAGALLLTAAALGWFGFGTGNGPLDAGPAWPSFFAGLTRVFFSFFAGVLIQRLRAQRRPAFATPPWLVVFALCFVLGSAPGKTFGLAFDLAAVMIVFPAIVYLGATARTGTGRALSTLGDASYAIYVLQFPLFGLLPPLFAFLLRAKPPEISLTFGLASVAIVTLVAFVSDAWFDRPARRWLTRRLLGQKAATL